MADLTKLKDLPGSGVLIMGKDVVPRYEKGYEALSSPDAMKFNKWLLRVENGIYRVTIKGGLVYIPFSVHKKLCDKLQIPVYERT